MDNMTRLIDEIWKHLPTIANTLPEDEWTRFRNDLVALQPRIDGSVSKQERMTAYLDLYNTCIAYSAVRHILPAGDKMLTKPPPATTRPPGPPGEDPPLRIRNRMSDLIERMDEIKPLVAAKPAADPMPNSTEDSK
jgi:hypothetical protein